MKLDPQAEQVRANLQKAIEQGAKLEYLYSLDEFKFFLGWIKKMQEELASTILNGKLLDGADLRKEDFNKGGYNMLTKIIEGAERFSKGAVSARKKLEKFDQDIKEMPEAFKDAT